MLPHHRNGAGHAALMIFAEMFRSGSGMPTTTTTTAIPAAGVTTASPRTARCPTGTAATPTAATTTLAFVLRAFFLVALAINKVCQFCQNRFIPVSISLRFFLPRCVSSG